MSPLSLLRDTSYVVIFVRTLNGTPHTVGKKKLSRAVKPFKWKDTTVTIDFSKPLYRKRNENRYVYDLDLGQMFCFNQGLGVDPRMIKALFRDETIRQLSTQATKRNMFDIAYIGMIVLVGLGLAIGFTVGQNVVI